MDKDESVALFYYYSNYVEIIDGLMEDKEFQAVAELVHAMGLEVTGRSDQITFSKKSTKLLWISIKPNIVKSQEVLEKGRERSKRGLESVQRRKDRQANVDERTNQTYVNVDVTQNVDADERTRTTYVDADNDATLKTSNHAGLYVADEVPSLGKNIDLARCEKKPSLQIEIEREIEREIEIDFFLKNACAYEDAKTYHEEKKYKSDLKAWWNYWATRNWEIGGKKLVNWKASIDNWESGYQKKIKKTNGNCMKLSYTDQEMDDLEQRLNGAGGQT
ncbi:MAG: hypothetical protein KHZ87_05645 [Clostridiales bacterium]|nr:hypothetical protein [Clostridiales bacterium]MBS5877268.1 hypothetical protein [Clostridiales bacterium]